MLEFRNAFKSLARLLAIAAALLSAVTLHAEQERKAQKNDWAEREQRTKVKKVDAIETIQFAQVGDRKLELDLYRPEQPDGSAPLIIWVHGGAWRVGSRKSMPLKGLVEKGYAIASIDYRLTPTAPFPANVHDIKAAIRFLRANAERYSIAPDRITLAGASAGGHLAALAGLTQGSVELEGEVGDHLETSSEVQAIVSFFGASNLTTILSQSTEHGLSVRVPALELLLEGQPDEKPALAKLASPIFQLDTKDPPVLLFHGDKDNQMPFEQAQEFKRACDAAKVRCEFHTVPGAGHGGKGFYDEKMIRQVDEYLRSVHRSTTPKEQPNGV